MTKLDRFPIREIIIERAGRSDAVAGAIGGRHRENFDLLVFRQRERLRAGWKVDAVLEQVTELIRLITVLDVVAMRAEPCDRIPQNITRIDRRHLPFAPVIDLAELAVPHAIFPLTDETGPPLNRQIMRRVIDGKPPGGILRGRGE